MLKVFLTIDTEVGYRFGKWSQTEILENIKRDVFGITSQGEYGIKFMIDNFEKYKIKANFFVESIFNFICGDELLCKIVSPILDSGNDIQLHIHPEWLRLIDKPIIENSSGFFLKDFSEEQQYILIKKGLENLKKCGVNNINAFRAGSYAINFNTFSALARNNINYDTSYNPNYLNSTCDLKLPKILHQPKKFNEVWEFPINSFRDSPLHYRNMQFAADSINELKYILFQAWTNNWYSIVIVMHSFALINRNRKSKKPPNADYILLKRFEEFCSFLSDNRDKFLTSVFSELDYNNIKADNNVKPLKSKLFNTIERYYQQIKRRYNKFKNY